MCKGDENRTHHIHAYPYDNIHEIQRHISFRNYLRNHPDIAKEYGELKSHLALSFPNDITRYSKGKDSFIKKVEARSLKEDWRKEQ
ncbi:hypothetical protein J11TS1_10570 [Oceanobacillus sp. J11TS1]|nr:hypothetical protein J11TS1_10570 [Oceanobacillus sp. J11TS1]